MTDIWTLMSWVAIIGIAYHAGLLRGLRCAERIFEQSMDEVFGKGGDDE